MSGVQRPEPAVQDGRLMLDQAAPGLEPLSLFFDLLLESATLEITSAAAFTGAQGQSLVAGETQGWGGERSQATLDYGSDGSTLRRLDFSKPIAAFEGLDLEIGDTVKLSGLTLHLHVEMPEPAGGDYAHVTRSLTGTLRLGTKDFDFTIENPVESSAVFVEVTSSLSLADAAHLFGNPDHPEADLEWLPESLRAGGLAALHDLRFRYDPAEGEGLTMVGATLVVEDGHRWQVIPAAPWLSVGGLSLAMDVHYPLQGDYRFATVAVTGQIQIGEPGTQDGVIQITARWPDLAVSGGLVEGSAIHVGALLRKAGLSLEGLPADPLRITQLSFTAEPTGDPKAFSFYVAVTDAWSFPLPGGKASFALEQVSLRLTYSSAPGAGMGGEFAARLNIAGVEIDLRAAHTASNAGWQFEGGTAPGATIEMGALIDDLGTRLGVADLPEALATWKITSLHVAVDTKAQSYALSIATSMSIDGHLLDATLAIDLKRGEQNYSSHVGGTVTIAGRVFDLDFSQDPKATVLVAAYRDEAGGSLSLAALLQAVGASPDAAAGLEIDVKSMLFVYDKAAGAATSGSVLFAVDIGAGINLSNLPFVGKLLPGDQTLKANFQPVLASAAFDKPAVDGLRPRLPAGVVLQGGDAGYDQGLSITGSLQIGNAIHPFGQAVPPDAALPKPGDAGAPAPAVPASPPPAKSDDVKWFDVQKSLGPVSFRRVGVQYDRANGILWALLDASLAAGPLDIALDGLAAGSSIRKFEPHFGLRGMSVDFSQGGIEIGGAFLRRQGPPGEEDEFAGEAIVRTPVFTLSALGAYTRRQNQPSIFVYGVLDYPLGGPAFFFVTGLAAGFGYNRDLKMPVIDQVADFPLVSQAIKPPGQPGNLEQVLESLALDVPPDVGEIFLCVGIRFSTFKLVDSFALLAVQFGHRFEIDLLGLSTAAVPPAEEGGDETTPLVEVQLALMAAFLPDEGFLGIQAQLTANSYLFSRSCRLTGGFAFFTWFKDGYRGGHAGDFVLTLGGYHPAYRKPPNYPDVPRLGFDWQVSDVLVIKGGMYFALTGHAVMAGGGLQALWSSGPLKAWFLIGADFLIAWKPYHYDARVYIDIGVSFTFELFGTHTITLDLGADLHLWGPEFAGIAQLHILIFTVTIHFGADTADAPQPLDWAAFRQAFLPAPEKVCSLLVAAGLVSKPSDAGDDLGIVNAKELRLVIESAVPSTALVWAGARADEGLGAVPVHIGPMGIADERLTSTTTVTIARDDGAAGVAVDFVVAPIRKAVPAALWGTSLQPDLQSKEMIAGAVAGFEIRPAKPPEPGRTHEIDRGKLRYATSLASSKLGLSARALPAWEVPADSRMRIEQTVRAQGTADARRALLERWGFREDRDVHLRPGYAANLLGDVRMLA